MYGVLDTCSPVSSTDVREKPKSFNPTIKANHKMIITVMSIMKFNKRCNNLAIQLQKSEANIIIHRIGTQLMELGIYFLTVHDSIICRKSDADKVVKIFTKEFKQIKLNPTLNIKDLN